MARGDLTILQGSSSNGSRGARLYNVAAGTPILAGEPVQLLAVGDTKVIPGRTSIPVVGTSGVEGLFVGIAATDSTNSTTVAGTVNVIPTNSDITWLINPAVAASWDTQSEYDDLVGKRVLIQNNAFVGYSYSAFVNTGTYSLLASDSAANGAVVQALDISKYPGKVAIAFRKRTSNLS